MWRSTTTVNIGGLAAAVAFLHRTSCSFRKAIQEVTDPALSKMQKKYADLDASSSHENNSDIAPRSSVDKTAIEQPDPKKLKEDS